MDGLRRPLQLCGNSPATAEQPKQCIYATPTLMGIPAELRLEIFYYLIPHASAIKYQAFAVPPLNDWGADHFQHKYWMETAGLERKELEECPERCSLMLVNTTIAREIRDILYHRNVFWFDIAQVPHCRGPTHIRTPYSKYALRHMRHVCLQVTVSSSWADSEVFDHCIPQLKDIVRAFNERAEGTGDHPRPQLTNLTIRLYVNKLFRRRPCLWLCDQFFGLRGINHVVIRAKAGDLPPSFSRALEFYIQGKGGELASIKYPSYIAGEHLRGSLKKYQFRVEQRQWFEPRYDWYAFARRNGFLENEEDVGSAELKEVSIYERTNSSGTASTS